MEVTAAFTVAMLIALVSLQGSLTVLTSRTWTVMQVLTDAYLSQETAMENRYPYEDLTGSNTLWPTWPDYWQSSVSLGKTGTNSGQIYGTIQRFKELQTPSANYTGAETYLLTSILTYQIGSATYVKTRMTLRTR